MRNWIECLVAVGVGAVIGVIGGALLASCTSGRRVRVGLMLNANLYQPSIRLGFDVELF